MSPGIPSNHVEAGPRAGRQSMSGFRLLCVLITVAAASASFGQEADATSGPKSDADGAADTESLPVELAAADTAEPGREMLLFEDMPTVVSAARQAQPVDWLSVPVSVVTGEDIHHSGLTRIPEILQFVPGMDVLRIDRNRYAVGIRGLHETVADRTLALIDGRPAISPVFGGAEWLRWPLLTEDIKRIEVVRGPGGAAFVAMPADAFAREGEAPRAVSTLEFDVLSRGGGETLEFGVLA